MWMLGVFSFFAMSRNGVDTTAPLGNSSKQRKRSHRSGVMVGYSLWAKNMFILSRTILGRGMRVLVEGCMAVVMVVVVRYDLRNVLGDKYNKKRKKEIKKEIKGVFSSPNVWVTNRQLEAYLTIMCISANQVATSLSPIRGIYQSEGEGGQSDVEEGGWKSGVIGGCV